MMPVILLILNLKVPKPVIFMIGIPLFVIGILFLAFYPENAKPQYMLLFSGLAGIGYGFVQPMPWLTFPDIIDVAELKSGDRNPGAYNGTMTFFKKFASGIAVFLVGVVLQSTGFDSTIGTAKLQPPQALTGMRYVIAISISVFMLLAFISGYMIKITTRKSERIRYFIEKQRAGELHNLSEKEQNEYEKLAKELF